MDLRYNPKINSHCAAVLCASYASLIDSGCVKRLVPGDHDLQLTGGPDVKDPTTLILYLMSLAPKENRDILLPENGTLAKANLDRWIALVTTKNYVCSDQATLHTLEKHLLDKTFFGGHQIGLCDLILFASVHAWFRRSTPNELRSHPCLIRWFNHIQNLPGIFQMSTVPYPYFELDIPPEEEFRKGLESLNGIMSSRMEGKKVGSNKNERDSSIKKEANIRPQSLRKEQMKTKNDIADASAHSRPIDDITRLNICVGKIVDIWNHPDSDFLYYENIDLGEAQPRQIVSNLRSQIPIDQMRNSLCLVVANLPVKKLRGKESRGMILCAANDGKVELIKPPTNAKIGQRIQFDGLEGDPDLVLSNKKGKEPFPLIQKELSVRDKIAYYKTLPFKSAEGVCTTLSIVNGTIS